MDKPTQRDRAERVLEAIKMIKEFVSGIDEVAFVRDVKIQSAVQYQFLIIGEAIRYIEQNILVKYSYPWHIPRSFRNFIIHVYHGVNIEKIYSATQNLDELEKQINLILKNEFT